MIDQEPEDLQKFVNQYKYVKSKCSCKISEIQGFIYGGITSRFWIFRKHILSMDKKDSMEDKNFPFFPWECITI